MKAENNKKVILSLCGGSGSWERPYKEAGYTVYNITLPKYNVLATKFTDEDIIFRKDLNDNYRIIVKKEDIYGILAAPPCTHFSFARVHPKSSLRDLRGSMKIIMACLNVIWECQYYVKTNGQRFTGLKFWALENPNGFLKYFLGHPAFKFHPYEFMDMYKKETYLWGWFNRPIKTWDLKPNVKKFDGLSMKEIKSKMAYDPLWKNTKTRQEMRAITPPGFTKAFFKENR